MSTSEWTPSGTLALSPKDSARLHQQLFLDEVAAGRPINERMVMAIMCELVLSGAEVAGDFQRLANAVQAKSFVSGKLPDKPDGRRKGTGRYDPTEVAAAYYDGVDGGEKSSDVYGRLAEQFSMEVSGVRKLVQEASPWMPDTKEARDQERRNAAAMGLEPDHWDYRNRAWREAVKAATDDPSSVAGLSLDQAIALSDRLLQDIRSDIQGKK